MNQETLSTLAAVASKLGTTSEYLWGVLLKQAPIHAATSALTITIWVVAASVMNLFVYRIFKSAAWEQNGEGKFFAMVLAAVFTAAAVISLVSELPSIITALTNPEYWALRQIIR